jgi:hypothetical protein
MEKWNTGLQPTKQEVMPSQPIQKRRGGLFLTITLLYNTYPINTHASELIVDIKYLELRGK